MSDSDSQFGSTTRDLTGQVLGDYEIIRRLGHGGMANVYLARQRSLQRRVAIKILKPHLASDENYVRRFLREAQAAASLVHANIVQIHEVNRIDGRHVIVQEFVHGLNLKQLLDRHGCLSPEVTVSIARQITVALAKAHDNGIVHRDIKPENILLAADGMVKVADFGLARVADDRRALELTDVGVTMGTPLYMSPEQVEGGQIDARSDMYSLGVTCYHMLAARPPFEGDTPLNVAIQHLKKDPQRLEQVQPELPIPLCDLVHRMLAKSPSERFSTAAELLRALRDLSVESPGSSWPVELGLGDADGEVSLSTARFAETQQLASVVHKQNTQPRTRNRFVVPILLLAGCLAGALLAYSGRPRDPLALRPGETLPEIERMSSAHAQYVYAFYLNTEEAWLAVVKYFGTDASSSGQQRRYVRLAKQQLIRRYLDDRRYDAALAYLNDLANLDDAEAEFRAFGVAGQAIVYSHQGKFQMAAEKLADAAVLAPHLTAEDMRQRLKHAEQRIRSAVQ